MATSITYSTLTSTHEIKAPLDYFSYSKVRPAATLKKLNAIIWVALSGFGWAFGMLLMVVLHSAGGHDVNAIMPLASVGGLLLPLTLVMCWDACRFGAFYLKHSMLGANAAAWTLLEDTRVKAFNWWYLRHKLSKRDLETAQVLAVDFTGNLGELIKVSKSLS